MNELTAGTIIVVMNIVAVVVIIYIVLKETRL
jgi:hypothetical protein